MRRVLFCTIFLLLSVAFVYGQPGSGNDPCIRTARDSTGRTTTFEDKECRERQAMDNRISNLRNNGKQIFIRDRYKEDRIFIDFIRPLYRSKLTKEETQMLKPADDDLQKYADFTNMKNGGIVKLLIDKDCDGGTDTVSAKPECAGKTMPGAGSSYSFRANRYSMERLADLTFKGKTFDTEGLVKHSILVNIGDVPVSKVSKKTKELDTLVTFKPITKYKDAEKMSTLLKKGVDTGTLIFSSWLKVKENNTYALRSIAYKSDGNARQVQDTVYDEFDFDERDDVLIVFRVVRLVPNESVTIIWKQLSKKRAPKIRLPKDKRNN